MLPVRDGITIVRRAIPAAGNAVAPQPAAAPATSPAALVTPHPSASTMATAPTTPAKVQMPSEGPNPNPNPNPYPNPNTPNPDPDPNPYQVQMASEGDLVCRGVGGRSVLERMRLDGKVAPVTGLTLTLALNRALSVTLAPTPTRPRI